MLPVSSFLARIYREFQTAGMKIACYFLHASTLFTINKISPATSCDELKPFHYFFSCRRLKSIIIDYDGSQAKEKRKKKEKEKEKRNSLILCHMQKAFGM
jgi:hypothetical protein